VVSTSPSPDARIHYTVVPDEASTAAAATAGRAERILGRPLA